MSVSPFDSVGVCRSWKQHGARFSGSTLSLTDGLPGKSYPPLFFKPVVRLGRFPTPPQPSPRSCRPAAVCQQRHPSKGTLLASPLQSWQAGCVTVAWRWRSATAPSMLQGRAAVPATPSM